MCLETNNGSGMIRCLFGNIFLQIVIGYRSFISERLVEFNNKVIFKVKSGSLSQVDLGIGKYFFELGAGKENFEWSSYDRN